MACIILPAWPIRRHKTSSSSWRPSPTRSGSSSPRNRPPSCGGPTVRLLPPRYLPHAVPHRRHHGAGILRLQPRSHRHHQPHGQAQYSPPHTALALLELYPRVSGRKRPAPSSVAPFTKVEEEADSLWEIPHPSPLYREQSRHEEIFEEEEDGEALKRILGYIRSKAHPDRFALRELKSLARRLGSSRMERMSWRGWMQVLRKHGLEHCVRLK